MKAEEAKARSKDRIDKELELIYTIIQSYAMLGSRCVCFDRTCNGIHPRTLKILEEEGFSVVRDQDEGQDTIFVAWY